MSCIYWFKEKYCDQYDKISFMFIKCLKPPGAITGIARCPRAHRTAHGRSALISDDLHLLLPVGGHFELTNPTKGFYIHILYGCQWCSNFVPVDPPFVLPYASIPAACATLCTALNSLTLQNIVQATCIWCKFETSVCTVGRVKFDSLSFTCLCRRTILVYSAYTRLSYAN